jgi:hypothetical protein
MRETSVERGFAAKRRAGVPLAKTPRRQGRKEDPKFRTEKFFPILLGVLASWRETFFLPFFSANSP